MPSAVMLEERDELLDKYTLGHNYKFAKYIFLSEIS